ncbi:MAG: peptidoglycan editing factor PgeF [Rhodospirillales bacterium]
MIESQALGRTTGIRHAFFTRRGGVSEGEFASLNCGFGSGDDPGRVEANRSRAAEKLGIPPPGLVTCRQIHSISVAVAEKPWPREQAPEADGLVTKVPGIALGVLSADCPPVLLADTVNGIIGAAHAGWRGAKDGIVEAVVDAMISLGAEASNISAAIGPCIQRISYEVDADFHAAFVDDDEASGDLFDASPAPERYMFDLPRYVERRLNNLGVKEIEVRAEDTRSDEARFFSYRRATLRGEENYGRGLSAIMLNGR